MNNTNIIDKEEIASVLLNFMLNHKLQDYCDIYELSQQIYLSWIINIGLLNIPGFTFKLFQNALVFTDDIEYETEECKKTCGLDNIAEIRDYFVNKTRDLYYIYDKERAV